MKYTRARSLNAAPPGDITKYQGDTLGGPPLGAFVFFCFVTLCDHCTHGWRGALRWQGRLQNGAHVLISVGTNEMCVCGPYVMESI